MRIAIYQQNIEWGNPQANQKKAEDFLNRQGNCDLCVLPEMWSTGFATEPKGIAEADCDSLRWMQQQARERGTAIAGSIATEVDGTFRNRFYFVKADGRAVFYDKHHLFSYGGEHLTFTAGHERKIVELGDVRFLLQVCYDLRFPVWSRNRGDYDAIIYVASWPTSRLEAWKTLLRARAIENQCYVIGVNRTGNDPKCEYSGGSAIIDPYGKVIAACPDGEETDVAADIDMAALNQFREKFPVLKDGAEFRVES